MKALRKVPEARYPTVAALAEDVRRWLDAQPVSAGRDAWRYRASRLLRRHRSAIGVAAAVAVAIAHHRGDGAPLRAAGTATPCR